MITTKKIEKRFGGYICRRCINEVYKVDLTRHDCIYKSFDVCPRCGVEHNIVHDFRSSGVRIMKKAKVGFRARYVVLPLLAVLIIGGAFVAHSNWDLIQAARIGLTTDLETIQIQQKEKDQALAKELGIEGVVTDDMAAQTAADLEAYLNGGGSVSGDGSNLPISYRFSGTGANGGGEGTSGSSYGTGTPEKDIIATYTAQLYGLRDVFQGRLNGLMDQARAEYAALPEGEQTSSAKRSIINSRIGQGEAMEEQCDAMVDAYLKQMESELKAAGQSTDSVKELRDYYEETKINQKAAYMAQARNS